MPNRNETIGPFLNLRTYGLGRILFPLTNIDEKTQLRFMF